MTESNLHESVAQHFDAHPINEAHILQSLQNQGVSLETLTEDILKAHDQDHYGGVEANDILAQKAGITASSYVLDVCCGLGGPARYLAHNYGCRVMGIDLTQSRIDSAHRLSQLVKLDHLVDFRHGNALDMPFANDTFDVIVGQEAWLFIPDKARLFAECVRVLKAGGIIAFTDIVQRGPLSPEERERLRRDMAFPTLETFEGYVQRLTEAGYTVLEQKDLGDHWAMILRQRLEMYQGLNDESIAMVGKAKYQTFVDTYSFFVGLFASKQLGGGRFIARLDSK